MLTSSVTRTRKLRKSVRNLKSEGQEGIREGYGSPNDYILQEARSETRSSHGIVRQDVEASSKLIVDSRTMASR